MIGIRSLGWYVPEERRSVEQVAAEYGVAEKALRDFGLKSKVAPGPEDHPASLAAKAARAALHAVDLPVQELDLLIFVGVTRDRPAPWVAAFGVLHELGASKAAGFDLSARCPGLHDALWVGASLIRGGSFKNIVVCCGDRFDHLLPATRPKATLAESVFSAGGAAALLGPDAENEIAAYSHCTHEDLSLHPAHSPAAGGSRWPLDARALETRAHEWQSEMTVAQAVALREYLHRAERHNIQKVCRDAGFADFDFIAVSPSDVRAQTESLRALGIEPDRFLMTLPLFGHMGPADSLVSLGVALQEGRAIGPRLVMSTRSVVYANALAIRGNGPDLGIRIPGSVTTPG
jgi:3-oxoacyl-[acyl-carrier-protein] synthase-3